LLEHPAVADVAVIGIPHDTLGEEVVAIVQLSSPGAADEAALIAFARECLASYKVPAHVVIRTSELPRTSSGKVLKRVLREQVLTDG
jgi:acyl-CoA synthetase (AMP-forming)/AMP-acid ligase II